MDYPLVKKSGLRMYKVRGTRVILARDLEAYLREHSLTARQRRVLNLMYKVADEMVRANGRKNGRRR